MNFYRVFLLAVTLTFLCVGLVSHSLPANSPCECISLQRNDANTSGFGHCLICQLQTGVHTLFNPAIPHYKSAFPIDHQLARNAIERALPILHPPIA